VAALALLGVCATNLVVLHEAAREEALGNSQGGEADTIGLPWRNDLPPIRWTV
jgi:hypothetical protein